MQCFLVHELFWDEEKKGANLWSLPSALMLVLFVLVLLLIVFFQGRHGVTLISSSNIVEMLVIVLVQPGRVPSKKLALVFLCTIENPEEGRD